MSSSPIATLVRPLLVALPILLASCGGTDPYVDDNNVFESPGARKPQFGYQGNGGTQYANQDPAAAATTPPADAAGTTPPAPTNPTTQGNDPLPQDPNAAAPVTPPTTKPKPAGAKLEFGIPVIGKKGFVYSPHAPEKGMVDVVDLPSGTKVECPYTFKFFRVP